ncbi:MAG: histidine kinase [Bacteroidetes bacterium]|nr:histidine kinase [Bacteroidota bacterium]
MILTYGAWWIIWIVIQTWVLHSLGLDWGHACVDATISNVLLTLSGYVTEITSRYYNPDKHNRWFRFAWAIALAVICSLAINWILAQIYFDNHFYLTFLEKSAPLRFVYAFLMISFMGVISWLMRQMKEEQESKARKNDAENLLREAELSNLRQQIQPHFLFNSLNSISALVGTRPEEARKMIYQLSDFLRGTLKKDEQQLVTLSEELQHLQLYLEIEKVRFGHRLIPQIDCDEESLKMKLPSLLLQPIVENAIKFGLYDTIGEVIIKITAKGNEKLLSVHIENPYDSETSKPKQGTGFGLNSVQRRLYLLYARNDLLTVQTQQNIFITSVKIPQSL